MNQKELLSIIIVVFISVIVWVFADLRHISSTQQVDVIDERFTRPINVRIDTTIFDQLELRK